MIQKFTWMVLAVFALACGVSSAQTGAGAGTWSVVVGDDVAVRSGPSVESFYHFHKVKKGDMVRVVGESNGWAQVKLTGPAFADAYGYVKADQRVQMSTDGKSGTVVAKTDLLAPNLVTKGNPDSSWKPLARLNANDALVVLGTVPGSRDTVYKVKLPAEAEGYINQAFLRPASADELSAYEAKLGKPVSDKPLAPTATAPKVEDAATPRTTDEVKRAVNDPATPGTSAPVKPVTNGAAPETPTNGAATQPTATDKPVPAIVSEESDAADGEAPATAPAIEERVQETKKLEQVTLSDLEWAHEVASKEPMRSAEFGPLRQRYLEFAARPGTSEYERKYATLRADKLSVREKAQQTMLELEELKRRNNMEKEDIEAVLTKIQARADYVAVGRLNASSIYDGKRLPLLYRVQDDGTGQTVAYMRPGSSFDLTGMLGQLIGIVGEKSYDGALRLNLIAPDRIDVLGPRDAAQEPPAN